MPKPPKIETEKLDKLYLDGKNPRLGRREVEKGLTQDQVLELMKDWSLEELAVSFLESGYWPQEALIAVEEIVEKGTKGLVVVEGNRRLAALKMIDRTRTGIETSTKWKKLIEGYEDAAFDALKEIPYILQPSRQNVVAYLGFRHVTGIKEWNPAEKAQFISHLIENEGLDFDQVRKRIGSKTPTVRQNYMSYKLLLQMEGEAENIDVEKVEQRFSVLYLSLRSSGVQKYLHIHIDADPEAAKTPVPPDKLEQLANFARWLFGTDKLEPVVTDSRQVDDFGRILENPAAVEYLERNETPSFAVARRMAGVAESEVAGHIERAADEVEEALKAAHQHKSSNRVQTSVRRLGADTMQLLTIFPDIKSEVVESKV